MAKILIPDYFGQQIISAIRALAAAGDRCELAWAKFDFLGRFISSRYLTAWHEITPANKDPQQYIKDLIQLCQQNQYDMLIPFGIDACHTVTKFQDQLKPHIKLMVPEFSTFSLANDKLQTAEFCQQQGFLCPQVFSNYQENDVAAISHEVQYPVVIKARSGCGVDLLRYAHNAKQLVEYYHQLHSADHEKLSDAFDCSQPIIQEFIPGYIHDVCSLTAFGKPVAALSQMRKIMYPISGGVGALNITTDNQPLIEHAQAILAALNWHGPAQVEFKYDSRDKQYKLIEINPKFWGTLDLSIKAGMNFPGILRDYLLTGEVTASNTYQKNVAYKFRYPQLSLAKLQALKLFGLKGFCYSPRVDKVYSDFDWSDPIPDILRAFKTGTQVLKGKWLTKTKLDKRYINHFYQDESV